MKYNGQKYIVVGAGFYGATIAERIASVMGEKVLVLDKRNHIGGNSYSEKDPETNIDVHKYGSHIFHTNDEEVWNYINQFTSFNTYQHKVFTVYNNKTYSMPINLKTINDFYEMNLNPSEAKEFIDSEIAKYKIDDPKNLEEKAISLIGKPLYAAFIKGYTQKQWETPLTKLPQNIITRLPVRTNYNNRYFADRFEGIPTNGYTEIFEKMLSHKNIEIQLGVDFFDIKKDLPEDCLIIYTGAIDRFYDFKFGLLGWRTCDFEVQKLETNDFQGATVINYANVEVPYTRIHEFKHYTPDRNFPTEKTIIFKEFSRKATETDTPYYPINTDEDKEIFNQYKKLSQNEKNVIFGGRLGNYVYIDMHQAIAMALNTFNSKIKGQQR
jgi:UDP-galactopyranose mutase